MKTHTVKISDTDPVEEPPRSAAELKHETRFSLGTIKAPRAELIEQVKNARHVPIAWQEAILAEIALIPEKHTLLRLDMHRHPMKSGVNCTFTVCEL